MFFAMVRMISPEGYTADGALFIQPGFLDWQPVRYVEPDECADGTMCRACVHSWALDYEVELPSLA